MPKVEEKFSEFESWLEGGGGGGGGLAHAAVCVQLKKFGDKELQSTLV